MKILFTGHYNPSYNRNNIIIHGLRNLGVTIIEYPFKKKRITRIDKKQIKIHDDVVDYIFMPSFTHINVASVKKITTKPLLFDPLISRYLSKVFDYKAVWKYSPRAYKNYLKDIISMNKANLVFADTSAHKKYFVDSLKIKPDKIHVLPVGLNEEQFYPEQILQKPENNFVVGFYGSFIPLHGVDIIIETAALLMNRKDIKFVLLGDGVQFRAMKEIIEKHYIKNIELKGWIEYERLNKEINNFDVCLGVFGSSLKTDLVVPNKIYHYCACKKPVITKETPAIKEIFEDKIDILLTNASPEDIAANIVLLKENLELRSKLASEGYNNIIKNYNSKAIAKIFIQALSGI